MAKRAFVVGINDYRNWHSVGFGDLGFCRSDATAFAEQILRDGRLFSEDNITVCEDHEATRAGILAGIQRMLDASDVGDVACFYFAGHGDRNPVRGSPIRWAEAIVPYDGAAMISDAEINRMVSALEINRVNFTIVLDSCHSGGVFDPALPGTTVRTGRWPAEKCDRMVETCRGISPMVCTPEPATFVGNVANVARSAAQHLVMQIVSSFDFSDQAKATLISACEYDETAKEHASLSHGYFTSAMLDTVNQSNFIMSYNDFHQAVGRAVQGYVTRFGSSRQTPQLRGRPVRHGEDFLAEWTFSI